MNPGRIPAPHGMRNERFTDPDGYPEKKQGRPNADGLVVASLKMRPDDAGSSQYSRFFLRPGSGTGYRPFASGCTGAGESAVNLSRPGAISWSLLSMSSKVIS